MRCRIFLVESVVLIVLMEALNGLSFLMERHRRRLHLSTARMFPRFMISSWQRGLQQQRSRKAHFPNSDKTMGILFASASHFSSAVLTVYFTMLKLELVLGFQTP